MNSWIKTCRALAPSLAVRLGHGATTVIVIIILLGPNALSQSDSEKLGMSAHDLVRRVVTNELKFQVGDHSRWMYRLEKEESGRKQVKEIVETNDGSLSRLLSINGCTLTPHSNRKRTSACRGS